MGKRVSPQNLKRLWENMKNYVRSNMESFSETRLNVDVQTGHLVVQESGDLNFFIDGNGHLNSEVT